MLQESTDLLAEAEALHGFLGGLRETDWSRPTAFKNWTPWDVVAHLHFYDRVALLALQGREAFAGRRDALVKEMIAGTSNAEMARREFAELAPAVLLDRWIDDCREMAKQLGESDASRRLPWFGPDMGLRMFTTARLMETWAHGQGVYDLLGASRVPTDRLHHIATIGVKTFGWAFVNRRMEVPGLPPRIRLVAPSGAIWDWNEANEQDCISGEALDFCQVVTQTRNVADTALDVKGPVATSWMSIVQCFAGPPVDPPKPGERGPARA